MRKLAALNFVFLAEISLKKLFPTGHNLAVLSLLPCHHWWQEKTSRL